KWRSARPKPPWRKYFFARLRSSVGSLPRTSGAEPEGPAGAAIAPVASDSGGAALACAFSPDDGFSPRFVVVPQPVSPVTHNAERTRTGKIPTFICTPQDSETRRGWLKNCSVRCALDRKCLKSGRKTCRAEVSNFPDTGARTPAT